MGYINIFVSKNAHIFIKNSQLFLEGDENKIDFPLEDINSVMIENLNTTISTYTLSSLADFGILTFVCNKNHIPNGVLLPYCSHYHTLRQYKYQVKLSKPTQKQLWQTIVKNKIHNQNEVLNICGGGNDLLELENSVLSGDSSNNEAKASLIYFKKMFGSKFARRNELDDTNALLNYGYSILRGFIARSITSHGLTPFLGINHHNEFNDFNLADDLIEPFRPIVDLFTKINFSEQKQLDTFAKSQLFGIVNFDVEVDGLCQTVSNAIDIYVESFIESISKQQVCLKQIKIVGLNLHKYE